MDAACLESLNLGVTEPHRPGAAVGTRTHKVVPRPRLDSRVNSPPSALTRCRIPMMP